MKNKLRGCTRDGILLGHKKELSYTRDESQKVRRRAAGHCGTQTVSSLTEAVTGPCREKGEQCLPRAGVNHRPTMLLLEKKPLTDFLVFASSLSI